MNNFTANIFDIDSNSQASYYLSTKLRSFQAEVHEFSLSMVKIEKAFLFASVNNMILAIKPLYSDSISVDVLLKLADDKLHVSVLKKCFAVVYLLDVSQLLENNQSGI